MDVFGLAQSSLFSGSAQSYQPSSSQTKTNSSGQALESPPASSSSKQDRLKSVAPTRQEQLSSEGQKLAQELTKQQEQEVRQLEIRDAQVKAHERAHKSVGGQYTGAISYVYQAGPDGKRYAIGGEVPIDASPVSGDPQATIDKMNIVKAAALAPSDPSAQDRRVASLATQAISEARVQIAEESREEAAASREEAVKRAESTQLEGARTYERVGAFSGSSAERTNQINTLV